jgi:hypothetical protein
MNTSKQHPFGTYWCDPEAFHPSRVNTVDALVEALFEQGKRPEQQVFWDDQNLCWNSGKWAGEGFENWFYIAVDTAPDHRINVFDYLPTINDEFGADGVGSFRLDHQTVVKMIAQLKLVKNPKEELSRFRQENLGNPVEAAWKWDIPIVVFVTTAAGINYKMLQNWNENGEKVKVINRARLKEVYDYHPTVWQNFYNDLLTKQATL